MATSSLAPGPETRPFPRRRILFVGGSLNQTTIVHKIARELPEHDHVFTPYYADGAVGWAAERGLLDFTILGGRHKAMSEAFLRERGAELDPRGAGGGFDLVVTTSDLVVPAQPARRADGAGAGGDDRPRGLALPAGAAAAGCLAGSRTPR